MQFPSKGGSAYFAVSQRQPLFLFLVHVRNEPFTQNTDVYNVNDSYEDCHFAVIHLKTTTEKKYSSWPLDYSMEINTKWPLSFNVITLWEYFK